MRKILRSAIVLVALFGCKQHVQRHDLFYGSTQPPIVSITIGDVQFVKPIHKSTGPLTSPSMISPNRLAVVNTVEILKGKALVNELAWHTRPVGKMSRCLNNDMCSCGTNPVSAFNTIQYKASFT
jgi:hypothetical protein